MKKYIFLAVVTTLVLSCSDYTEDFPVPPASTVAKFEYASANNFEIPDTVTFTDMSIIPERAGSVSYLWDFGDGETSTDVNPVHVFDTAGVFNVSLTLTTSASEEVKTQIQKLEFIELIEGDTLLFEDFESWSVFPEDWVLVNVDGNTPSNASLASMKDSAWIVYKSSYWESHVALGVSYYEPEAGADDWMILPAVEVTETSKLQWQALSMTTSGNYPDSYQIYVSTTTQDVAGCKKNPLLYRIIDEEFGDDIEGGEGIQTRSVSLKQYAGKSVHVAFRLMTPSPGGDRLAIDNILIFNE